MTCSDVIQSNKVSRLLCSISSINAVHGKPIESLSRRNSSSDYIEPTHNAEPLIPQRPDSLKMPPFPSLNTLSNLHSDQIHLVISPQTILQVITPPLKALRRSSRPVQFEPRTLASQYQPGRRLAPHRGQFAGSSHSRCLA